MNWTDDKPPDEKFAAWLATSDARLAAAQAVEEVVAEISDSPATNAAEQHAWSCLVKLERLRRVTQSTASGQNGHTESQVVPHPTGDAAAPRGDEESLLGAKVGRFELVSELGRGGCGIVALAHDPLLDRLVALKLPRPEVLVTGDLRRRFLNEAKAAAALRHLNIVTIYEVGDAGPICWLAAEYCPGPSLREFLNRQQTSIPVAAAARLVAALAEAVEHAHRHGVLHRDLKPSNVMLSVPGAEGGSQTPGAGGQPLGNAPWESRGLESFVPKLTDFGLAKLLDRDSEATQTGTAMGTPCYMAPEQIEARRGTIGPGADVYGLGVILFELLTGNPPLRGETNAETMRKVLLEEPDEVRLLRPQTPRDLEAIVSRCLEKSPQRRYASAQALADDLHRFLQGRPTAARPLGVYGRTAKSMRRHPMRVALVGVVMLALAGFIGGGLWHVQRLERELTINERLRHESEQRELTLRQERYLADMQNADQAWKEGKLGQTLYLLDRYDPAHTAVSGPDVRDFRWGYLWQRSHSEEFRIADHQATVCAVRYSPDGTLLATAGHDGTARLFEADTGKAVAVMRGHRGNVNCIEFLPSGQQLVSGGDDGALKFWEVPSGRLLNSVEQHEGDVLCLAVDPAGKEIASGGVDQVIRIWNCERERNTGELVGHTNWVRGLAFSSDGDRLVSTGHDEIARCWNVGSGSLLWSVDPQVKKGLCVDLQPTANGLVAVGGHSGKIALLRPNDGSIVDTIETGLQWVRALHFNRKAHKVPAGIDLSAVGERPLLESWLLKKSSWLQRQRSFTVHGEPVWSVAYAPNCQFVATASEDGLVKVWRESHREDVSYPLTRPRPVLNPCRLDVEGNGRVAAFAVDNAVEVWDISARKRTAMLGGTGPEIHDLALSTNAKWLISGGRERPTEVYDVQTATVVEALPEWASGAFGLDLHPEDDLVAVSIDGAPIRIWSRSRQEIVGELPLRQATAAPKVRYSACGRFIAAVEGNRPEVVVWNCASRREVMRVPAAWRSDIVFSPDSMRIAYCADDYTLRVVNRDNKAEELRLLGKEKRMSAFAFSPDGQQLASVANNETVQIWDLATGRLSFGIESWGKNQLVAFAEGGKSLVVGRSDSVRIFSTLFKRAN